MTSSELEQDFNATCTSVQIVVNVVWVSMYMYLPLIVLFVPKLFV